MRFTTYLVLASSLLASVASAQDARPKPNVPGEPPRRVGRIEERPQPCKPIDPDAAIRLEFDGAPIGALLAEVARLTCRRFILDENAAGTRVNVISGGEIRARELWPTFLQALAVHGLAIVDRGSALAIIPATDGTRAPIPTLGPDDPLPEEERMVTKLLRVREGDDINAVTNYLNIFKSGKGQIHPWSPGNLVVATDYTSSLQRVMKILAAMQAGPPAKAAPKREGH